MERGGVLIGPSSDVGTQVSGARNDRYGTSDNKLIMLSVPSVGLRVVSKNCALFGRDGTANVLEILMGCIEGVLDLLGVCSHPPPGSSCRPLVPVQLPRVFFSIN